MAMIGLIAGIAGAAIGMAGASRQASALRQQAAMEQQLANYKNQLDLQQGQEQAAIAQRTAQQQELKTKYVESTFLAQAAASGTAATSTDITLSAGRIGAQGEYDALSDLYRGQVAKYDYTAEGQIAEYEGDIQSQALNAEADQTMMAGLGGLIGGIGGAFGKFG
jgi:uncharacterized membrane-anchored protein YhcB (DUF1043 family)